MELRTRAISDAMTLVRSSRPRRVSFASRPGRKANAALSVMLRAAWFLLTSVIAGRARPNAFFDGRGVIIAEPKVLSDGGA